VYKAFVELVEADQAAGLLPADLDPGQLALSELALTLVPVLLPQVSRLVTGISVNDPAFGETRAEFLRAFSQCLAGVREVPSRS
jgi:hypothetical protein